MNNLRRIKMAGSLTVTRKMKLMGSTRLITQNTSPSLVQPEFSIHCLHVDPYPGSEKNNIIPLKKFLENIL
jgi:hypothetical protein